MQHCMSYTYIYLLFYRDFFINKGKKPQENFWMLFTKRLRYLRVEEPPTSSQLNDLSMLRDKSSF